MDFRNSTDLDSTRIEQMFVRHAWPYRHDKLKVRLRYSRGADFSGTCYYGSHLIYVNLGAHTTYPYPLVTHVARCRSNQTHWWRETHRLTITDAYQLVLFVFLHEFYHYLVKLAGRNPRQKEGMCDRFATRELVDHFRARLVDLRGRPVHRDTWDFQDLHKFVEKAPKEGSLLELFRPPPPPRKIPVKIFGTRRAKPSR